MTLKMKLESLYKNVMRKIETENIAKLRMLVGEKDFMKFEIKL